MSGQLLRAEVGDPMQKHTHVVLTFDHGRQLRFVDPRTFGELFVTTRRRSPSWPTSARTRSTRSWTRSTSAACWPPAGPSSRPCSWTSGFWPGSATSTPTRCSVAAGLRFDRPAESLSPGEVRRLHVAMVDTLQDAIVHRGSSLADEQYRDLFGAIGDYQSRHQVYDREGRALFPVRHRHRAVKANGRSTFFCTRCQI